MKTNYVFHLNRKPLPETIGNKAKNLTFLITRRFRVPNTYICTWEAYLDYKREGQPVLDRVKKELESRLDPQKCYAVRSSANIEDSLDHSFAGQFMTVLNVREIEAILQAIRSIWDATHTDSIQTYMQASRHSEASLKMAVLLQEMVEPQVSGVAFSRNPITGLDEIVVEAVHGMGTALVQDGITPSRWIYKWGKWVASPQGETIPIDLIRQVVLQTKKIAQVYRRDVDLEWVYDGRDLYWLQVREITAVQGLNIYSNRITKEMTPGLIKPLVWSVTVPIHSTVWIRIISELIGPNDLDPTQMMRAFYYRSYLNNGFLGKVFQRLGLPGESLEMMMGVSSTGMGKFSFKPSYRMAPLLPRLMRFLYDKWTYAPKAEDEYARLQAETLQFSLNSLESLDENQLISSLDALVGLNQQCAYHSILCILLMQLYNRLLKSRLAAVGVDFLQFDLTEGMEELRHFDPAVRFTQLHRQFTELDESSRERILSGDYEAFCQLQGIEEFQRGVAEFFDQFGHLSDSSSDFSAATWRETPGLILQLIASYPQAVDVNTAKVRFKDLPTGKPNAWIFQLLYRRARQFRLLREMYSSLLTYTLMLIRRYYLALGQRLAQRNLLESGEDILYLYDAEIRSYLNGNASGAEFTGLVAQRRNEIENWKDVALPEIIYGEVPPLLVKSPVEKLTGIPTSGGYCTGKIKVVRSLRDFSKLNKGEILVIPYSDVGWTPLFARAGAVIAESGGILSHSSIIAREYNIPAVVSVAGALKLEDNTLVTVNGYRGEILVHDEAGEPGA